MAKVVPSDNLTTTAWEENKPAFEPQVSEIDLKTLGMDGDVYDMQDDDAADPEDENELFSSRVQPRVRKLAEKVNKREKHRKADVRLQRKALVLAIFGVLGILLAIVEMEIAYCVEETDDGDLVASYRESWLSNVLKMCISADTVITIMLIFNYYWSQAREEKRRWNFTRSSSALTTCHVQIKLWTEVFVCLIHPIPFFDPLYDRVGVWMFMRLYLFIRVGRDFTEIYQKREDISEALVENDGPGVEKSLLFDWILSFKTVFYVSAQIVIPALVTACVVIFAYVILVAERTYNPKVFYSYGQAVWFTVVSMTTVGYGDITVLSPYGRLAGGLAILAGLLLSSLLVAAATTQINLTQNQKSAADWLVEDRVRQKLRSTAAYLIQSAWRHHVAKRASSNMHRKQKIKMHDNFLTKMIVITRMARRLKERLAVFTDSGRDPVVLTLMEIKSKHETADEERSHLYRRLDRLEDKMNLILKKLEQMPTAHHAPAGTRNATPSPAPAATASGTATPTRSDAALVPKKPAAAAPKK